MLFTSTVLLAKLLALSVSSNWLILLFLTRCCCRLKLLPCPRRPISRPTPGPRHWEHRLHRPLAEHRVRRALGLARLARGHILLPRRRDGFDLRVHLCKRRCIRPRTRRSLPTSQAARLFGPDPVPPVRGLLAGCQSDHGVGRAELGWRAAHSGEREGRGRGWQLSCLARVYAGFSHP